MSIYAYIHGGEIVEFKELSDSLHQSWISNGNPKADVYLPVVFVEKPSVSDSEIVEESFNITENDVNQVWTIRNKTASEKRKIYTAYQFLLLFTAEERAAFRNAAKTDEFVADFMSLAQAAQEIITDDPLTVQGMGYLVYIGLLTENRKDEILA